MRNNLCVMFSSNTSRNNRGALKRSSETTTMVQQQQQQQQENEGLMLTPTSVPAANRTTSVFRSEKDSIVVDHNNHNEDRDTSSKTTALQSFLHLLKGYVGPGCLSLPWAVSLLGIVPGCFAIFGMAFLSSYNCWTVVQLKRRMISLEEYRGSSVTYPAVAAWLYGRRMGRLTMVSICVLQLCICTVFLSFCGANLQAVVATLTGRTVDHTLVVSVVLPACMALSCLPNLKALAPVTILAMALLLCGLGVLLSVVGMEWGHKPDHAVGTQLTSVPLALCAILYSFEGICLVLPVENSMARPQDFVRAFSAAMFCSAVIFCMVGGLTVAAFGRVTNGSVTAFLLEKYEDDESLKTLLLLANAAVSFSVLVTYPLQLFPCLELVEPLMSSSDEGVELETEDLYPTITRTDSGGERTDFAPLSETQEKVTTKANLGRMDGLNPSPSENNAAGSPRTRVILVLITYIAAIAVPNVESLISLAGALAGSSTALLLPPALQIAYSRRHNESALWSYGLFAGGFVFMMIGTIASLTDIVRIYSS